MIWLYLVATIFGGAFVIPMVLGGLDTDVVDGLGELGDGADVGTDLDGGVDVDLDVGDSPSGALSAIVGSLLTFRTAVFFSAFFGTSGLVFGVLGYSTAVTLFTALLIGSVAAVANSALFGLIRRSQTNSQISDSTLEGRRAKVVLPIEVGQRGRIRIDLSGQPQYAVARAYDDRSEQQFDVGASVVVVKIENGTALVASLAELDLGEEQT